MMDGEFACDDVFLLESLIGEYISFDCDDVFLSQEFIDSIKTKQNL